MAFKVRKFFQKKWKHVKGLFCCCARRVDEDEKNIPTCDEAAPVETVRVEVSCPVYHEEQVELQCALHAVNGVLQDSVFEAENFNDIASQLDKDEAEIGEFSEISQNYAPGGNYSIQVITVALDLCFLELIPFNHSSDPRAAAARRNTSTAGAYILNRDNHWYAFRRIGSNWYNLNSLLPGPKRMAVKGKHLRILTPQYIASLQGLFIVAGDLPTGRRKT